MMIKKLLKELHKRTERDNGTAFSCNIVDAVYNWDDSAHLYSYIFDDMDIGGAWLNYLTDIPLFVSDKKLLTIRETMLCLFEEVKKEFQND